VRLRRPHFLDGDLRFVFPQPGNRAVLFTVVSGARQPRFQGEMERQAYWWRRSGQKIYPSLRAMGSSSIAVPGGDLRLAGPVGRARGRAIPHQLRGGVASTALAVADLPGRVRGESDGMAKRTGPRAGEYGLMIKRRASRQDFDGAA
jgi:hypothetical protein